MKRMILIIGVIIDLLVYGFVYYLGYKRGKEETEIINQNIVLDVGKIAEN